MKKVRFDLPRSFPLKGTREPVQSQKQQVQLQFGSFLTLIDCSDQPDPPIFDNHDPMISHASEAEISPSFSDRQRPKFLKKASEAPAAIRADQGSEFEFKFT